MRQNNKHQGLLYNVFCSTVEAQHVFEHNLYCGDRLIVVLSIGGMQSKFVSILEPNGTVVDLSWQYTPTEIDVIQEVIVGLYKKVKR